MIRTVGELIEELERYDKRLTVLMQDFEGEIPIDKVYLEDNEVRICEIG